MLVFSLAGDTGTVGVGIAEKLRGAPREGDRTGGSRAAETS